MEEGLLYLNVYLASGRALVNSLIKEGKEKNRQFGWQWAELGANN